MLYLDTPFSRPGSSKRVRTDVKTRRISGLKRSSNDKADGKRQKINNKDSKLFAVLWRKVTNRKNKPWDGDGVLRVSPHSDSAIVKTDDGNFLGKVHSASTRIYHDQIFKCGGKYECQLNGALQQDDSEHKPVDTNFYMKMPVKSHRTLRRSMKPIPRISNETVPKISKTFLTTARKRANSSGPLYDPKRIKNPLIMTRPPHNPSIAVRDVIVDPRLSDTLRPHQREGIKFLYECVMGFHDVKGNGSILADEMGLGKTLQAITLIWTLMKQSPYVGEKAVFKNKILICCPVTLVSNWKHEFHKWFSTEVNKPSILALDGKQQSFHQTDKAIVKSFTTTNVYQILIIGYEKMQSLGNELQNCCIDLLICDEGHRLKNSSSKAFKMLNSFNAKHRIILTGTPIQNDLTEFYNLIDFVNPGLLGTSKDFQRNYAKQILRSRDPSCKNPSVIKTGNKKSDELIRLTKQFILRRTNKELEKYLPKRSDYILFTPPTKLQLTLFDAVTKNEKFAKIIEDDNSTTRKRDSLSWVMTFRKICNSPSLLTNDSLFLESCTDGSGGNFAKQLAKKVKSGKIMLLMKLLSLIYTEAKDEKVVIISNFTQVLDIISRTLESMRLSFTRLDGSTPAKDRGKIVREFNKSPKDICFAFLLSSKAGGMGLNLAGASRLILFDNDWNPSTDVQAMARIQREGQVRPVKIYRLMTSGCIDEKIFQRQLIKTNLSDRFIDDSSSSNEDFFNYSDLKDIFTVSKGTYCNTHDLMQCHCKGDGVLKDKSGDDSSEEEYKGAIHEPKNFVSALTYSQEYNDEEDRKKKAQKQIQKCLRPFRHIDPHNNVKTDDPIIDDLIRHQDKNRPIVGYIFAKY